MKVGFSTSALEPFFSALVSGVALGAWMRPQVYATLLPVVAGVALACYSTLSFSMAMSIFETRASSCCAPSSPIGSASGMVRHYRNA